MTLTQGNVRSFLVQRYLSVYPIYLTLWVVAVECVTAAGRWRPDWHTAATILALIAAGAFLRMVDDQKDLDYDTVHNPDRPLVTGSVTVGQLRRAMLPCAVGALGFAALVSVPAALVLAAALGYGLLLWWAESNVPRLRDNPLLNLTAVIPAQFLVTAFIMLGEPGVANMPWWHRLAVPVIFTAAFLHLEFARKTSRVAGDDPHSYARLLGATPSAWVALAFAVLAVVLARCPLAVPLLALPLASTWIFLRHRPVAHPTGLSTAFVVLFYLALTVDGLRP
ncbi:hypothetical protein [Mycobacterium sp. C31M]